MYSQSTQRTSKGFVSIGVDKGYLRLQLPRSIFADGKQRYISLKLKDTPENRAIAEHHAKNVQADLTRYQLGDETAFDFTLEKYKPKSALSTVTPVTPIGKPKPELDQLWDRYSEFKKPQISPSTYAKDFTKHRNHIAKLPTRSLDEAPTIRDYLVSTLSSDVAKRCLTQIKACCNWALEAGLIDANPFAAMKVQLPKDTSEEQEIHPFSKEERDLIIRTFASDRYYSHYTPYVRFLFFTGCRPSEAVALKWKHINNSVIQFRESVVVSEEGLVVKDGLKTQKKRDFPLTPEVQAILDEIRPEEVNPESLIFTSPKGKFIDHHNFSSRAWKAILSKCDIPYRKSYQTRHTFISLCVEAHINSTAISRWTGTSAKMIDNHYGATNFTNLRPPDLS